MRTAMPLVTCSRMTERPESASSESISTPRLIGPGCMISTCGDETSTPAVRQAVERVEYSGGWEQRLVHPFPLHTQQVQHVEVADQVVEAW